MQGFESRAFVARQCGVFLGLCLACLHVGRQYNIDARKDVSNTKRNARVNANARQVVILHEFSFCTDIEQHKGIEDFFSNVSCCLPG